jgi:hypothetical protein
MAVSLRVITKMIFCFIQVRHEIRLPCSGPRQPRRRQQPGQPARRSNPASSRFLNRKSGYGPDAHLGNF